MLFHYDLDHMHNLDLAMEGAANTEAKLHVASKQGTPTVAAATAVTPSRAMAPPETTAGVLAGIGVLLLPQAEVAGVQAGVRIKPLAEVLQRHAIPSTTACSAAKTVTIWMTAIP